MKKAFITGALGFVGRHLADGLVTQGWQVAGIDLARTAGATRFSYARVDILDAGAIARAVTGAAPDFVFHLAAVSSVALSQRAPRDAMATNITGSLNLLDAIREMVTRPRLLFVSSCEVYGQAPEADLPVREETPLRPLSPYAASKACSEELAAFYGRSYGLEVVILRPFTHTGPGQSENFVFPSLAHRISEIERGELAPVLEVGNVDVQRDYMDVRDVVRAYVLATERCVPGEVYNITSGKPISIRQGIEMMLELSPKPAAIRVDPSRVRPSDIRILTGDGTKFAQTTGWKPEIPLRVTFSDLLDYYRTGRSKPQVPNPKP